MGDLIHEARLLDEMTGFIYDVETWENKDAGGLKSFEHVVYADWKEVYAGDSQQDMTAAIRDHIAATRAAMA